MEDLLELSKTSLVEVKSSKQKLLVTHLLRTKPNKEKRLRHHRQKLKQKHKQKLFQKETDQ